MDDIDKITFQLLEAISAAVGNQLTQLTDETTQETFPAVLESYQEAARPDFPFITVSTLNIRDAEGFLTETYNDENGVSEVAVDRLITYRVYCWGANTTPILNTLKTALHMDYFKQIIKVGKARLYDLKDVKEVPKITGADDFNKNSYLDLTLSYRSTFTFDQGYFDHYNAEGDIEGEQIDIVIQP